jgi:Tetratricopeptide repeat
MRWILPTAAALLVVAILAASANPTDLELAGGRPAEAYYSQLAEAFRNGQVSLQKPVPPGLAQLADPYDPAANYPYRLAPTRADDLSYYRGRFYLYFGPTPALVLFWPWAALTGRYLFHSTAALIFCLAAFFTAAGLLRAIRRRCFPEVGPGVAAAGVLAVGLASSMPILLQRGEFWEVPIACASGLTLLALAAVWRALSAPVHRTLWLAAASLAYGLAIGARPSVLFGAVILLIPPLVAWTGLRQLAAATGPAALCALGLLLYNARRFGSPFEFGWHYQLAAVRQGTVQPFGLGSFWLNLPVYLLRPAELMRNFPFVRAGTVRPLPAGHPEVEAFGILTNLPIVWLALAAPLAWRQRPPETARRLRGLVAAAALLFIIPALTLCSFFERETRYELEFLPPLVLLAVIGIFALERALGGHPGWRRGARAAWGLLLAGSIAFNLLNGLDRYAEERTKNGNVLLQAGDFPGAARQFQAALRVEPALAVAQNDLGNALLRLGRTGEAAEHYAAAARLQPQLPEPRYNLGNVLTRLGRLPEAEAEYERALALNPAYAEAHYNLSVVLAQLGRGAEAEAHYREALRLRPEMARGPGKQ